MALNLIWIGFFVVAFIVALIKLIFFGDYEIFPAIMNSTFDQAATGFQLSLGLTGIMTLWLGIMRVGEKGGAINYLAKGIGPLFNRLFPEIPKNHPVHGNMVMNVAANMLGLDNAATPMGLKAMTELQKLNKDKDRASNSMIMFLVLNTSGLTIIPITVMVYRAQLGAIDPSDIFLPILLTTFISTLVGIIAVSIYQRINLLSRTILMYLGSVSLFVACVIWGFTMLNATQTNIVSSVSANIILFSIIIIFIGLAVRKKINVYDTFIEGAKEGFNIAIKIIPFLVAILVSIGVFRVSGAMDFLLQGLEWIFASLGANTEFVDALPVAFMKPLSGGGARGMMLETMTHHGVDSFAGKLACTFQGATDTTFYIIAVYFGSVGIRKVRHAVSCGLIADLAGILAAIFLSYLFFY